MMHPKTPENPHTTNDIHTMISRFGIFNLIHKNEIKLRRQLQFNIYKHKTSNYSKFSDQDERN